MYRYGNSGYNDKKSAYDIQGAGMGSSYDSIFQAMGGGGKSTGTRASDFNLNFQPNSDINGGAGIGVTDYLPLAKKAELTNALNLAQMNNQGYMDRTRLQSASNIYSQMLSLEADKAKSEAERKAQLEMQRRQALGEDYGTKQQFFYKYGL